MKINVSTTKEVVISDDLLQKIKDRLNTMENPKVYWDYRDQLSEEQVGKIISGPEGLNDVENEIFDYNMDCSYELEQSHIIACLGYFKSELEEELGEDVDLKEIAQELRDELLDFISVDMGIKGLIRNSNNPNARVTLYSNYDCINSNWYVTSGGGYTYEESYFGAMLDFLNLNPAKVKKVFTERGILCSGKFPSKKTREGKEYVDYTKFAIEMENNSCTGNLSIVCKIDLSDVLRHGSMPKKFTIPKGNGVGMYSDFQGGGSMFDCELIRDMEIDTEKRGDTEYDRVDLIPDTKEHGYTMKDTYGVTNDFFGNEISFK